jgi:hypothetical protein
MEELEEKEYLVSLGYKFGYPKRYRLLYQGEGQDGSKFMPGLVNIDFLKEKIGQNRTK